MYEDYLRLCDLDEERGDDFNNTFYQLESDSEKMFYQKPTAPCH